MAAGVFHVEFGINDTQLTRALEQGNYASAERYILENSQSSYLDEGCYQRTPLFICLCGIAEDGDRVKCRNFYLAKLMLERGADVNYRVPVTFYGCEYLGPGKTCLELLIDFYNEITRCDNCRSEDWVESSPSWDSQEQVIGLNRQLLDNTYDILEDIEKLIFICLANGCDVNVRDGNRMTPLHRITISSYENKLLHLLYENGADINGTDIHGNTPLLSLCDVAMYDIDDDLTDNSPSSSNSSLDQLLPIQQAKLDFFLSKSDTQINVQNNLDQTPLFHCIMRGDVTSCYKLLLSGADPTLRGVVWETRRRKRKISPIFASFLSIPIQQTLGWQSTHYKLTAAPQRYSHIVDAGHFTKKEIAQELVEYIENDFPEFLELRPIAGALIHLLFGRTTSTLSQLATRCVFQNSLIKNTLCLQRILPVSTFKQKFLVEDLEHFDTYEEYVCLILNRTVLKTLINLLNLPQDSLINFEVELLLHQMAVKFSKYKILRPDNVISDLSDESVHSSESDSSNDSLDEGDSDLEYW
ncbi:hypothetical protein LOTGIDRAFT_235723 [Lottia gigantea]|uniref:Uncharacterized protein n=1 Tax=Lottia gigantea TaxID=225164 RepID=V3ZN55_LOTGI|nr:hypothetical protein LOTGIDRAFT_235723 [Lottia gigantea]ESO85757.1 hypothetical protein LOTGIDRAFT_235723 [Lottia gigantea]